MSAGRNKNNKTRHRKDQQHKAAVRRREHRRDIRQRRLEKKATQIWLKAKHTSKVNHVENAPDQ